MRLLTITMLTNRCGSILVARGRTLTNARVSFVSLGEERGHWTGAYLTTYLAQTNP